MKAAVFLDRDGVLIEDVNLLSNPSQIRIFPGVPQALISLKKADYLLVIVSNQTVVSRGLLKVEQMLSLEIEIEDILQKAGSPFFDGFFYCPHHPNATLENYRLDCACRKPKPGLLFQAASQLNIDLERSYMVGDRLTDVLAGLRAGCQSILVQTGQHNAPFIQTSEDLPEEILPSYRCNNLFEATNWILGR